jgi:hypothetical protein
MGRKSTSRTLRQTLARSLKPAIAPSLCDPHHHTVLLTPYPNRKRLAGCSKQRLFGPPMLGIDRNAMMILPEKKPSMGLSICPNERSFLSSSDPLGL